MNKGAQIRLDKSYLRLTPMEADIMRLREQGLTYQEIAVALGKNFGSVRHHGAVALQKYRLARAIEQETQPGKIISTKRAKGRTTAKKMV